MLVLPSSVAPAATSSVTWLRKWIVPDRNLPPASRTVPPPAAAQASIAFWIAPVQSVSPSGFAPNRAGIEDGVGGVQRRQRHKEQDGEEGEGGFHYALSFHGVSLIKVSPISPTTTSCESVSKMTVSKSASGRRDGQDHRPAILPSGIMGGGSLGKQKASAR